MGLLINASINFALFCSRGFLNSKVVVPKDWKSICMTDNMVSLIMHTVCSGSESVFVNALQYRLPHWQYFMCNDFFLCRLFQHSRTAVIAEFSQ